MRTNIKLIEQDFDSLEDFKFTNPFDCPIARALKREGFKNVFVSPHIAIANGFEVDINGSLREVLRVAKEIKEGAEYGLIEII